MVASDVAVEERAAQVAAQGKATPPRSQDSGVQAAMDAWQSQEHVRVMPFGNIGYLQAPCQKPPTGSDKRHGGNWSDLLRRKLNNYEEQERPQSEDDFEMIERCQRLQQGKQYQDGVPPKASPRQVAKPQTQETEPMAKDPPQSVAKSKGNAALSRPRAKSDKCGKCRSTVRKISESPQSIWANFPELWAEGVDILVYDCLAMIVCIYFMWATEFAPVEMVLGVCCLLPVLHCANDVLNVRKARRSGEMKAGSDKGGSTLWKIVEYLQSMWANFLELWAEGVDILVYDCLTMLVTIYFLWASGFTPLEMVLGVCLVLPVLYCVNEQINAMKAQRSTSSAEPEAAQVFSQKKKKKE